ncbi:MAG: RagB/SusD family nutrient uptake outer membrane protein [Candidatus Pseudobacter hemicellulosilyticus]|uniref:RagB/SusD family nutrient uptake outer membrane protein n=1 Tax=Candidatus Pseudobacter hemicellulosilyticus TaxID=3121375 RepID=A0AAJ5WQF5_9BACT|nr:MAG: RagB/SusD family nutrient uptake outer membrane protein [Pseudobacter sp.]
MRLKYLIVSLLPALMGLPACNKFLDVKPKTQIEEEVLYQRESGFKDVLWGAYVNMASPAMYGREMTFGIVDVIGQAYARTGSTYGSAKAYDYANGNIEPMINGMWQSTYNTIANLNNLIAELRTANRSLFAEDNYNVILGEALGLRAYLHFDMLRLYAPSFRSDPAAKAIPYVTQYSFTMTPESTVAGTLDKIQADFTEAAALLKTSDPIITNRAITANIDEGYLLQRNFRFNYYAVRAAMARVYLYRNDLLNAGLAADEVIASGKFSWITVDEVAVADESQRNRTFTPEQVFVLNTPRMSEYIADRLTYTVFGSTGNLGLYYLTTDINALYPEANDWRKLYFWTQERNGVSSERFSAKLQQPAGMPAGLGQRMPLIRLPELYLTSAEANLDADPQKAIQRIRDLRIHRGLDAGIPDGTPTATLMEEMKKEYRREFITEGMLFYYYKRLDAATVDGVTGNFNKANYVLPKPAEETELR